MQSLCLLAPQSSRASVRLIRLRVDTWQQHLCSDAINLGGIVLHIFAQSQMGLFFLSSIAQASCPHANHQTCVQHL